MINGEKDLKRSRSVSKKLLLTMRRRGRLPMLNLSAYAKQAILEHMEAPTSFLNQHCQYQTASKKKGDKKELRRALAFSSYSNDELARMDAQGVKILGIDYDIDHTSPDWALGITHED